MNINDLFGGTDKKTPGPSCMEKFMQALPYAAETIGQSIYTPIRAAVRTLGMTHDELPQCMCSNCAETFALYSVMAAMFDGHVEIAGDKITRQELEKRVSTVLDMIYTDADNLWGR